MKVKIKTHYNVMCPNEHGANGEEFVIIVNRRVELKKCQKCKWYIGMNYKKFTVECNYKGNK